MSEIRCCCGKHTVPPEGLRVNNIVHEQINRGFCGTVEAHEIRRLSDENAALRVLVAQLVDYAMHTEGCWAISGGNPDTGEDGCSCGLDDVLARAAGFGGKP